MCLNGKERKKIYTYSQSAPWAMVVLHALPNSAKSAERMEGAMMAGGDMLRTVGMYRQENNSTRREERGLM